MQIIVRCFAIIRKNKVKNFCPTTCKYKKLYYICYMENAQTNNMEKVIKTRKMEDGFYRELISINDSYVVTHMHDKMVGGKILYSGGSYVRALHYFNQEQNEE